MKSEGFLLIELMLAIGAFIVFVTIISAAQGQIAMRQVEAFEYYQAVSYLSAAIDQIRVQGLKSAISTMQRDIYTIILKRSADRSLPIKGEEKALQAGVSYAFLEASISWKTRDRPHMIVFNTGMVMP